MTKPRYQVDRRSAEVLAAQAALDFAMYDDLERRGKLPPPGTLPRGYQYVYSVASERISALKAGQRRDNRKRNARRKESNGRNMRD